MSTLVFCFGACLECTVSPNIMLFLRKYEPVEKLPQYIGVRVKTYSRLEVERKKDNL